MVLLTLLILAFPSLPPAQVHDDEGLLACGALPEAHLQAAGGGSGPHPGHDGQPGEETPSSSQQDDELASEFTCRQRI